VVENELEVGVPLDEPAAAKRFEEFIVNTIKSAYGGYVAGVLAVDYAGMPGLIFYIDDREGPLLEVLLAYRGDRVRYRVSLMRPFVSDAVALKAARLVENAIHFFSETGGLGVVYFVYVPGRRLVPPRAESTARRTLQTLFLSNLVFVFAISIVFSYLVYFLVGPELTPIALILSQIPLMLVSHKLVPLMMGDWRLDENHRHVYLVGLKMPIEKYQRMLREVFLPKRYELKRIIYDVTLGRGVDVSEETVHNVLQEYGFAPDDYQVEVRKLDLYGMVEEVANHYSSRVPPVYLSNIVLPNAAASGVGWRLSSLVVTTGLLSRLEEDEIRAVIGHEMSHVTRHDAVTFFLLSSAEYLSRVYMVFLFWPLFATFFGLLYFWLSLTAFFVIAKFVEARADLDSATRLGKARELASALRKIGLRRIIMERSAGGRLAAWLRWDPHPPITFRIEKLEKVALEGLGHSPWREAAESCLRDLAATIRSVLLL